MVTVEVHKNVPDERGLVQGNLLLPPVYFRWYRCLNLKESFICHKLTCKCSHLASHHQIALHIRSSKIQISVFQTDFFFCLRILLNLERRCLWLRKYTKLLWDNLNFTCCNVLIDCTRSFCNFSYNCNNIFTTKLCSLLDQCCIYTSFIKYNLDNSGTSLTSTNTRPPLLRFFCTQPIMVTVSPTFSCWQLPHLWRSL